MSSKTSMLIVGGGPVGLALAGDMGWSGIHSRLMEGGDGTVSQPRMDMVGVCSMEFCCRWGIVPWVESTGYSRDYPQDCAWVTDFNCDELGREPFPFPRGETPPSQSPQQRERCPQNLADPVLRRFAESHTSVQLSFSIELDKFEDLGTHVRTLL